MNEEELLEYYAKKFKYFATDQLLTLEELFRIFEVVMERNENAVSQD